MSNSSGNRRRLTPPGINTGHNSDNSTHITPPPLYRDLSPAPPFYSSRLGADETPIIRFDLVRFSRDWNVTSGHFVLADNGTDEEWTEIFEQWRPQWDLIIEDLRVYSEQQRVNANARINLEIPSAPIGRMIIRQADPPFTSWHIHGRRLRFNDEEVSAFIIWSRILFCSGGS
ncbi:hypothetical protein N7508_007242 [Penicillium antarcticum]|uniref:uncharacterized protein n=1 Tax=Penicillium antarcticum TaxID=416450 RepID=UPI0023A1674D|nr:uncharacterized protein N7508_007242 [Penicillium antarcticum]KAJ5302379.1 hypothetical protein N7508_007242 [Penicillium antarcticum]